MTADMKCLYQPAVGSVDCNSDEPFAQCINNFIVQYVQLRC